MKVGQIIATLRRERHLTQEQLAGQIGVSAAAVSKWESGRSHPDIELLMPIARLLNVSVDELIGYRAELAREQAERLAEEIDQIYREDGWAEGLRRCEAAACEYPSDAYLKALLASSIDRNRILKKEEDGEDGASLQERLWKGAMASADAEVSRMAKFLLACHYMRFKRLDEAEALIDPAPEHDFSGRSLLPVLYVLQNRLEEAEELAQKNLFDAIGKMGNELSILTTDALKRGDVGKARKYADAAKALNELFELSPFLEINEVQSRMRVAAAEHDREALLCAVERFVELILDWETPRSLGDNPFFDRSQSGPIQQEDPYAKALREIVTKDLRNSDAYSDLRRDRRFQRAMERLETE